jgi:catechol 2,3-dioxygenase-like lactoylglutathione lyase family enzyme
MLSDANLVTTIAVKDMDEAKKFYGDTLGLKFVTENPGGAEYQTGNSRLFIYPSQFAGTNQATYGGWTVDDIDATVEELKGKGVQFEQYDNLPDTVREGDIHIMGGKFKGAWFRDPSGNILALDNGEM